MAAPTPTTRTTPTGYKVPEGYQSLVTFSSFPSLNIWEIENKPPAIEVGDPINTTTQHNVTWRTMYLPRLKTLDTITIKFAFDPDIIFTNLLSLIGDNSQTITFTYPQNAILCFYGGLQKVEFDVFKEKEFPTGTMTVVPTNWDSVNKVEAGPVMTPAAGT
jgi:hypothetical protein